MINSSKINDKILINSRTTGKLNISNRQLNHLPSNVLNIHSISIPNTKWFELSPIHLLDISHNSLRTIPLELSNWFDLKFFYLIGNMIKILPDELFINLKKLNIFKCDKNDIESIPETIKNCVNMFEFSGSMNKIKKIPMNGFGKEMINMKKINLEQNFIKDIPNNFGQMKNIQEMNLSGNLLENLPESIKDMNLMRIMIISKNKLKKVPKMLVSKMKYLKVLDLRSNELIDICEFFEINSGSLNELLISYNQMKCLPKGIEWLKELNILDLSNNKFTKLEDERFGVLKKLTRLDLNNNDLNDIPSNLGILKGLKMINLDGNPMKKINRSIVKNTIMLKEYLKKRLPLVKGEKESIGRLKEYFNEGLRTKSLNLSKLKLESVPEEIYTFNAIKELIISNNLLIHLDYKVEGMKNLSKLDISKNKLTLFSGYQLYQLEVLDVSYNKLEKLSISDFVKLKELNFSKNEGLKVVELPENIERISSSFNNLKTVPEYILSLKSLEYLDLSNNKIRIVDPKISERLVYLTDIFLHNNNLRLISPLISKLNLKTLQLYGNPLRSISHQIIKKGTESILNYLRKQINLSTVPVTQEPNQRKSYDKRIREVERPSKEEEEEEEEERFHKEMYEPQVQKKKLSSRIIPMNQIIGDSFIQPNNEEEEEDEEEEEIKLPKQRSYGDSLSSKRRSGRLKRKRQVKRTNGFNDQDKHQIKRTNDFNDQDKYQQIKRTNGFNDQDKHHQIKRKSSFNDQKNMMIQKQKQKDEFDLMDIDNYRKAEEDDLTRQLKTLKKNKNYISRKYTLKKKIALIKAERIKKKRKIAGNK